MKHRDDSVRTSFCVVCDRIYCNHDEGRYYDDRFVELCNLTPVETEAGEYARQVALVALSGELLRLQDQARSEEHFPEALYAEIEACKRNLEVLQQMAPVAPLIPRHRDKGITYDLT